jgi:hypothetical protein
VNTKQTALIQVALEGVRLPATRASLIEYLRSEEPSLAPLLERLPDREYDRIDAVAEALLWPDRPAPSSVPSPAPESGLPPGGESYVRPFGEPGGVRHDAPPSNPPQKEIERAAEVRNAQAKRQKS